MNYTAVIFDLDGTLVDTLRDIADSINLALKKLSLPVHTVDSFRYKIGDGTRRLIERSLPDDRTDLLDTISDMQQSYYTEHHCDHSMPYDGVLSMLTTLKEHGLKLAVLSNKPDPATCAMVTQLFDDGLFDLIMGNRPGMPLKPDPNAALAITEQLGVDPDNTALLGDSPMDMQAANRAGMFAVGAAWGFRDRNELLQNGCQSLIEHPSELPAVLGISSANGSCR